MTGRFSIRALSAAALLALTVGLGACGGSSDPDPSPTDTAAAGEWAISTDQKTPEPEDARLTVDGTAVIVGNPDAEERIEIYMDFFCPHCVQLHALMHNDVGLWTGGDDVAVAYHVVDYLGPRTTHIYSARAANLLAYVADTDPASYLAVMDALLENKPETTTEEVTDEQLLELAREAGATLGDDAATALAELSYYRWVEQSTQDAAAAGITGIPQVWVDGARVAGEEHEQTAELVRQAVNLP
ncbi:MAG: thioredoxin domain-containing protein [bacterium]|nr:thioredoxin domain-containing protein [bacterium]